jgi:hypothetical protein
VGGPLDRTYAVWGKPVEATLKDYFAQPIFEGHIPPRPENIREAMVQTLAAQHRRLRDYEDAELPAWVQAWEATHPADRAEALALLAKEPAPLRKIRKGAAR